MLPQIRSLGGIWKYLFRQKIHVAQKLMVYSRVHGSEYLEEVLPGRFIQGPVQADIIGVDTVKEDRQGIPLK
jgi:hypothetical protein